eukprot:CAMPEP_0184858446 /NCGR_PEP_ID=MMETSP0580-20130426/3546_1 /TAXON_ID=1118495 /ORGANISM="Dactyliosolen fragilissimus" /LENGTH=531 /DNA_ID=CAMNT_0027354591 /DNA_START=44 /DNA_END=1639 /DNA_ORIENTATION=+
MQAILSKSASFARKRPAVCFLSSAMSGTVAYAHFVEWNSEKNDALTRVGISDDDNCNIELPRHYDRERIENYWKGRPVMVFKRLISIGWELLPLAFAYYNNTNENGNINASDQHELAINLREALTRLGPAFVKAGQQLSIRPDLLPPTVLKELQKLCDGVQPVSDEIALQILAQELNNKQNQKHHGDKSISKINYHDFLQDFEDLHLVASASLGQVYKGKLKHNGHQVAIKVQRPDMIQKVSLDLFLLNIYGKVVDAFTQTFTHQLPYHVKFIDSFARGSYNELDYEKEAWNQNYFKEQFQLRKCKVKVPTVYSDYTCRRVITTEWIEGVKLADAPNDTIRKLIPVGVELFLTQLLDIGSFHADPHPGNLYVTEDGNVLCLLDFGLCAQIDEQSRNAMTTAIVHLLTGDFDSLIAKDAKDLGFLPHDLDISELKPILTTILTHGLLESGSNMHTRKRKLMNISDELNEIFFKHPFSVPPFFALITRGIGLLEGIALSGDPDFDIFKASYPYARRRAMEVFGEYGMNQLRKN